MLTLGRSGDRSKQNQRTYFSWFKGFKNGVMKNYGAMVLILLIAGLFALMGYVFAYNTIPTATQDTAKLVFPPDSSTSILWNNTAAQNFKCNVTLSSNASLGNISLWLGLSSNFVRNTTNVTGQYPWTNATDYNWTLTLNDGTYNWSCGLAVNKTAQYEYVNSTNYTIKIDATAPVVDDAAANGGVNVSPRYNNFTSSASPTIYVNLTDVTSGINTSTIVMAYRLNTSGGVWTDGGAETISAIGSDGKHYKASIDASGLSDVVDVQVNVSDNATNALTTFNWFFKVDTAAPNVGAITLYNANSNTVVINNNLTNSTLFNITLTITDNTANLSTITVNDSTTTLLNKSGNTYWAIRSMKNFTCGGEGLCTFTVTATDQAGNANTSSFTVRVDNVRPTVSSFTSNATSRYAKPTDTVNFSAFVTDVSNTSSVVYLNGSTNNNLTTLRDSARGLYENLTTPRLLGCSDDAWCLLFIYANDSAGNVNQTVNYSIYSDNKFPETNATLDNVTDGDGDGNINLDWIDDAGETGETYRIYRYSSAITSLNIGSATLIVANFPAGIQYYEDNTTANGTTYWYALVTVDTAGNFNATRNISNSLSAKANDTFAPKLPTSVAAHPVGGTTTITWTNVTSDVNNNYDLVRYTVWYWKNSSSIWNSTSWKWLNSSLMNDSVTGAVAVLAANISGNSTTHSVNNFPNDNAIRYYYFVTTIDDANIENLTYNTNNTNLSVVSATTCTNGVAVPSGGCSCGGTGTFYLSGYCCDSVFSTSACPTTSTTGGGGGGGGAVVVTEIQSLGSISSGATGTFGFTKSAELMVSEVKMVVTKDESYPKVTVRESSAPTGAALAISSSLGDIYNYMSITSNVPDGEISKVTIKFKVPKSWYTEKGLDTATTNLKKYKAGVWVNLPTRQIGVDADYYIFEAESSGFTTYVVTAEKMTAGETPKQETPPVVEEKPPVSEEEKLPPGEEPVVKTNDQLIAAVIIAIIVLLLIVCYAYANKKRRK